MAQKLIITPEVRLTALQIAIRNHRGALKKLSKAQSQRDRDYWAQACEHWDAQIVGSMSPAAEILPDVKTSIAEFKNNLKMLREEVDKLIVDDLDYRFDAIIQTLLAKDSPKGASSPLIINKDE